MSWHLWAEELRKNPLNAVKDLLRGTADIAPFERVSAHEFLLAILPRSGRLMVREALLGEQNLLAKDEKYEDLHDFLDDGLHLWLQEQLNSPLPAVRKRTGYAHQVSESLQWLLYFSLPKTRLALHKKRSQWLSWFKSLTISAFLDPEFDYWQMLAVKQDDNELQFFWQSFISEAGRTRSIRYLNLGLLALANIPLSEEDGLRNLRLQVQALASRYQQRRNLGVVALKQLVSGLGSVMSRNPGLSKKTRREFLTELLLPLGEDSTLSVLSMLGLVDEINNHYLRDEIVPSRLYKEKPPGNSGDTGRVVEGIKKSSGILQAWSILLSEMNTQEEYLQRTGDKYHFVRVLDRSAREFLAHYDINDPEISAHMFQWIHLSLRLEADEPRRWMLWELALSKMRQPRRAEWVLWEMTRRFPDQLHCRVELARLLAASGTDNDYKQANSLLNQVLLLDPDNLHAYSILVQLAISAQDWPEALRCAQKGLQIDPSDSVSAIHLAQVYVQRNQPGDFDSAVQHLQRFINRYSGHPHLENYLAKLISSPQSFVSKVETIKENNDEYGKTFGGENDPAWRSFAESIYLYMDKSKPHAEKDVQNILLPFPQALMDAVKNDKWNKNILIDYEEDILQEFPLEICLWKYLRLLKSSGENLNDLRKIKDEINKQLNLEKKNHAPTESKSWNSYLMKHWYELQSEGCEGIQQGKEWLNELLERYQPLPAPLFS